MFFLVGILTGGQLEAIEQVKNLRSSEDSGKEQVKDLKLGFPPSNSLNMMPNQLEMGSWVIPQLP